MTVQDYNFAYLDEQTKRMIRRALLKALANSSRRCRVRECWWGWKTQTSRPPRSCGRS